MALHSEILDRPPDEGARIVALALLAEARERAGPAVDGADPDALHDFRVAVRRLRSTLRAWRGPLGAALRDKDLRRLRRVARATNSARDAEVLLAWVRDEAGSLPLAHRPAAEWMGAALERRTGGRDLSRAVERFLRTADRLGPRLARVPHVRGDSSFGAELARRIREQAREVRDDLACVETPADRALAHRARIAGKRLRYLLEPLAGTPGVDSGPAVKALKRLQDLLGELNDTHLAEAAIREARRDADVERFRAGGPADGPGLRPGLLALEQRARRRFAALFARLVAEVLAGGGAEALDPAIAVAEALEARAPCGEASPAEVRHLLRALPEGARDWPGAEEEQAGFLDEAGVREGFRVLCGEGGARRLREVAPLGPGPVPAAEPVDEDTFDAYWPLTAGRRLHRFRRPVPGAPGWRVEEHVDRRLVLAVGPRGAPPPGWLADLAVREVSEERAYRDEAVARRPARP